MQPGVGFRFGVLDVYLAFENTIMRGGWKILIEGDKLKRDRSIIKLESRNLLGRLVRHLHFYVSIKTENEN